jgi:5-methylcytosine-specific restriction enzyme A
MSTDAELTQALLDSYYAAGKQTGYWGRRFYQAVNRKGGLATVKPMLTPRSANQRKGLDAILEAGKPELSVEAVVLQPRFRALFTSVELKAAAERLGEYGKQAQLNMKERERLYPDDLPSGQDYAEGAKKQVRVNAYERNPKARSACLKHYGRVCSVCDFSFEKRYGAIGRDFIHVHHLKPLALTSGEYKINPVADLRPVCPNCHAMLHTSDPPLEIEDLRKRLQPSTDA